MARAKKPKPVHQAVEFGLDPLSGDDDMFRWFLLAYLFGKPIQSTVAAKTWQIFVDHQLDTPWLIKESSERNLVSLLHAGGYTRYQHVMARSLHKCMNQLISDYDGSIMYMLNISQSEDELNKQLQRLYGVGPKTAEIFMRETIEYFAQLVE